MAKDVSTNILWINTEEANVNKLYHQGAKLQNHKVKLNNFFPHQVWERKVDLFSKCIEEKKKDKVFKFKIKPGVTNIKLHTKQAGDTMWIKTNLHAMGEIPRLNTTSPKSIIISLQD